MFGFLLWSTLLTLGMLPILVVMYGRLAATEGPEMQTEFGSAHEQYARRTPRYFPHLRQKIHAH